MHGSRIATYLLVGSRQGILGVDGRHGDGLTAIGSRRGSREGQRTDEAMEGRSKRRRENRGEGKIK
jgi:hypothetical protein